MAKITKEKLQALAIKCYELAPVDTVSYDPKKETVTIKFELSEGQRYPQIDRVGLFYLKKYIKEVFNVNSELIRQYKDSDDTKSLLLDFILVNGDTLKPSKIKPKKTEVIEIVEEKDERLEIHFRGIFSFGHKDVEEVFENTGVDLVIINEDDCKVAGKCTLLPNNEMFTGYIRGDSKIVKVTLCTSHRFDFKTLKREETKSIIRGLFV